MPGAVPVQSTNGIVWIMTMTVAIVTMIMTIMAIMTMNMTMAIMTMTFLLIIVTMTAIKATVTMIFWPLSSHDHDRIILLSLSLCSASKNLFKNETLESRMIPDFLQQLLHRCFINCSSVEADFCNLTYVDPPSIYYPKKMRASL